MKQELNKIVKAKILLSCEELSSKAPMPSESITKICIVSLSLVWPKIGFDQIQSPLIIFKQIFFFIKFLTIKKILFVYLLINYLK